MFFDFIADTLFDERHQLVNGDVSQFVVVLVTTVFNLVGIVIWVGNPAVFIAHDVIVVQIEIVIGSQNARRSAASRYGDAVEILVRSTEG